MNLPTAHTIRSSTINSGVMHAMTQNQHIGTDKRSPKFDYKNMPSGAISIAAFGKFQDDQQKNKKPKITDGYIRSKSNTGSNSITSAVDSSISKDVREIANNDEAVEEFPKKNYSIDYTPLLNDELKQIMLRKGISFASEFILKKYNLRLPFNKYRKQWKSFLENVPEGSKKDTIQGILRIAEKQSKEKPTKEGFGYYPCGMNRNTKRDCCIVSAIIAVIVIIIIFFMFSGKICCYGKNKFMYGGYGSSPRITGSGPCCDDDLDCVL